MSEKLIKSLENGPHKLLKSIEGNWKGITRVWFEPGKLADESECKGTIRSVLNNMFALHEYSGSLQGKPIEGIAIYGCSLADNTLQSAWIDSFHNGTNIMFSTNKNETSPFSVMATYGGEPAWGWRTKIELEHPDRLYITMFNITPDGDEAKAVEIIYDRVK